MDIFILHADKSNPMLCQPGGPWGRFAMKICPEGGELQLPGLPHPCLEGEGVGHTIDRCIIKSWLGVVTERKESAGMCTFE